MKRTLKALIIFSPLLLTGCGNELDLGAPPPQHFVNESPAARAQQLNTLTAFRAQGAFSVQAKGKERIINYNWYHGAKNTYTLKLSTPGDFYQAVLRNFYGKLTFWRDPTQVTQIRSLQNFMMSELGWYIPLNSFYYWMRGLPAPGGKAVTQYDEYGHLTSLQQNGWDLQYHRYVKFGEYDLPTKIDVQSSHGDKVRIAVKDWLLYQTHGAKAPRESISEQNQKLLKSL
jgi:outer membrane lipoprotein LolB